MNLRCYQQQAVDAAIETFDSHRAALIVMPVGTGKTVVFSHIANRFAGAGRVMVIAHRRELIQQAASKIEAVTGIRPGVEMGIDRSDEHSMWSQPKIVVSSVQTQAKRMERFRPDDFSLVVADEAHHSTAGSWRKVIDYYCQNPELKILGVTATPDRADGMALGQVYDHVAYEYGIVDAIQDGYLVRVRASAIKIHGLDYSSIRTTAGDLNQKDLGDEMTRTEIMAGMGRAIIDQVGMRRTLVFATTVAQAEYLCDLLNEIKPGSARWVSGKTKAETRSGIVEDYSRGVFQFLVNVGVFTEGFDDPGIEVVAMGRPTKSRSLYAQMIGRGTRPLPGIVDGIDDAGARRDAIASSAKPAVEVLDFVGNAGRHALVSTSDILGGSYDDEIKARVRSRSRDDGGAVDVLDEMAKEAERQQKKRELEAAAREAAMARPVYSIEPLDPFAALGIDDTPPEGLRRSGNITNGQRYYLRQRGVNSEGLTEPQARRIIAEISRREKHGLCGYVQAMRLRQAGLESDVSPAMAAVMLRELAANRAAQHMLQA